MYYSVLNKPTDVSVGRSFNALADNAAVDNDDDDIFFLFLAIQKVVIGAEVLHAKLSTVRFHTQTHDC